MKVKVQGKEHDLSQLQVIIMLAVGWACFLGSWLTNIAYYSFHPSAVEIFSLSEKMKLFMIGRDVCSLGKKNPALQDEVEGENRFIIYLTCVTKYIELQQGRRWTRWV